MAQFQYTAVNNSGKKLSGIIGALSEDEARKELNSLGISVLVMNKVAETQLKTNQKEVDLSKELPKFEFEAYDKTGRKVVGSIPASNRYKAFTRLMEEYQFEVSYVVPFGASEAEKEESKKQDLSALKAEYEEELKKQGKLPTQVGDPLNEQFEQKRKELLVKVDHILAKIKDLLANYQNDISAENKKIIQTYMDKLLRIKSSTNLDYISHTSEELLKKVQDQELFLHKEKMQNTREEFKLETQKLMAELHSGSSNKKDLNDDIASVQEKLSLSGNKILKGIGQWLMRLLPNEEQKIIISKIKIVNNQIWTYRKLWLKAPRTHKSSLAESLKSLKNEKNKLKIELRLSKFQKSNKMHQAEEAPLITEEITNFLGWLLAFYLLAYFASHYANHKVFLGGNPLPGEFDLLASATLVNIFLSVFIWYILLKLKLEYANFKNLSHVILIPFGILLNLIAIFNL